MTFAFSQLNVVPVEPQKECLSHRPCDATRKERALATSRQTLGWVDETFTTVHKDQIDAFNDHLNEQNADIQFTKEIEENGKLSLLGCLVSQDNNERRTTVYKKTDISTDYLTNYPTTPVHRKP